jgi:hypothetical protein
MEDRRLQGQSLPMQRNHATLAVSWLTVLSSNWRRAIATERESDPIAHFGSRLVSLVVTFHRQIINIRRRCCSRINHSCGALVTLSRRVQHRQLTKQAVQLQRGNAMCLIRALSFSHQPLGPWLNGHGVQVGSRRCQSSVIGSVVKAGDAQM